jgi:hypothetical protein
MVFNFAIEYALKRVQINQNGFKLNSSHQILVYANYVNILGGSVRTIKKAEVWVVASKEIGLEVNAHKTEYMVMSRDQNAGRRENIKNDDRRGSFERMEQFKYLGTNLTNQNSIEEEIKSRLKSWNACYYSVQKSFVFQFAIHKHKG